MDTDFYSSSSSSSFSSSNREFFTLAFSLPCRAKAQRRREPLPVMPLPGKCVSPATFSRSGLRHGAPAGRSRRCRKAEAGCKDSGTASPNHCGQPVTGEHPQPITAIVALAADFPAETRIVKVNHVRADGEPANPLARQFHVQPCAGFLPHGLGNGGGDDGRVALNPQPAATAGNVCFAHHRLRLNFPPGRGTC